MADEHRPSRRGPEDAGGADVRVDEAVHDRRLARACGAADDYQNRGLHLLEARQEVVVGLADDIVARAPRPSCLGKLELQSDRGEVLTEPA